MAPVLVLVEGVMFADQPAESLDIFRRELAHHRDPFELGALHVMTTLTGSALVTLALARGRLSLDEAWALSNLEEDWTIELWGLTRRPPAAARSGLRIWQRPTRFSFAQGLIRSASERSACQRR
nr:hypothetical protein [Marinicella sp. W31]MDC2877160.1 hypothetical protein [Marinicella sp. W31]